MRRRYLVAVFAVGALIASPGTAGAGVLDAIWAWLSEFSGPGPFGGYVVTGTGCFQDGRLKPSPIAKDSARHAEVTTDPLAPKNSSPMHRALFCLYLEKGIFSSDEDTEQGYPEISVGLNDFGMSVRVIDGLDVGAGLGWVSFHNDRTDSTVRKVMVTPIRVVMRPLLLALPEGQRRRWLGALSVYWKETFVRGPILGRQFGQEPRNQPEFSGQSEMLRSFGFTIDVTALIPAKRRAP